MTNLQNKFKTELAKELLTELNVENLFALPKLEKIVVNFGLGEALKNATALENTVEVIKQMTGQAPVITKARKDISNFSLREGSKIGCMVTLRRDKMWDFLDRTMNIALPRVKDFRGLLKKFDKAGNYTIGFKEQTVYPEVDGTKLDKLRGFEITIVIKNSNPEKSLKFLQKLGMPFVK